MSQLSSVRHHRPTEAPHEAMTGHSLRVSGLDTGDAEVASLAMESRREAKGRLLLAMPQCPPLYRK